MVVIYFDIRPKRRKEDLYDREKELKEFEKSLKQRNPLTVISGVRRLGKTSLLLVGLNEMKVPYILVDFRGINPNSRRDIYKKIESAVNTFFQQNRTIWESVKEVLKSISGLEILGTGVNFSWKKEKTDLAALFKELEKYDVVLAFDEVQNLRGPMGEEFSGLLAHLYDYSDIRMILTGSEVGLLHDFLGMDNPKAPLYGRYFKEITLERFSKDESLNFLREGFRQMGSEVDEEILEYAVERLDGIVGWLVFFGIKSLEKRPSKELVEEVFEEAKLLVIEEFNEFLKKRKPAEERYTRVMEAVANGKITWERIKDHLEEREGKTIADSVLSRLLKGLVNSSFLERVEEGRNVYYRIADPILEECFKS